MLVLSSQLFLLKKSRLKQVFSWLSLTVGSYFDLSLVLFSTRIQKEKDKKVDWVSVNDGFSNDLKTIHFVENLGMTYVTGGGGVLSFTSIWCNMWGNRCVTHPWKSCFEKFRKIHDKVPKIKTSLSKIRSITKANLYRGCFPITFVIFFD